MKLLPYVLLVVFVLFCGCNREKKIEKAKACLEITQESYDKGESLLDCDSLIDVALRNLKWSAPPELKAQAYLWKGRVYSELGKPATAADFFLKGIAVLGKTPSDTETLGKLYDDLGNTYLYEGLYDEALAVFRHEYEMDKAAGNNRGLAFSLRNIGSVYMFEPETDSAFLYYQEAMQYARLSDDSIYLFDLLYNDLAICYKRKGEFDNALLQLEKISRSTASTQLNKSSIFLSLNRLDSAVYLLSPLINSEDIKIRFAANTYLSRIEEMKGNTTRAFAYYKTSRSLQDTISRQSTKIELKTLSHLYNIEKETARIKAKNRTWNLIELFSAIAFILVLIFVFIIRKKRRELAESKKEKDRMQLKNDLLFSEKEVEDLKNLINELQGDVDKLKADKSKDSEYWKQQIEKKELEISMLNDEITNRRFKTKPIYEVLKQIEKEKKGQLSTNQRQELLYEVKLSYTEYINQIEKAKPGVKLTDEEILVHFLTRLGFTSFTIAMFIPLTSSGVRSRISRLNIKMRQAK